MTETAVLTWRAPASSIELVKSPKSSLHCLQACMIMAIKSITGKSLDMIEAERLTGYVKGRDTWAYQMYLSMAELGLRIESIEIFDPRTVVSDFRSEIRRVFPDDDTANYIIHETDLVTEATRAKRCLENPNIDFVVRAPDMEDIRRGLTAGHLPLVSLDYGALHCTGEGFEGHMIIVSTLGPDFVEIYDPGPPGDAARRVSVKAFEAALHSPHEESGTVILVRK